MAALEMQLMNAEQYRFLADGNQQVFETRKVWVDGKPTDEDAVDDQGRKSFYVNVLAGGYACCGPQAAEAVEGLAGDQTGWPDQRCRSWNFSSGLKLC